jgi:hypothetical protein
MTSYCIGFNKITLGAYIESEADTPLEAVEKARKILSEQAEFRDCNITLVDLDIEDEDGQLHSVDDDTFKACGGTPNGDYPAEDGKEKNNFIVTFNNVTVRVNCDWDDEAVEIAKAKLRELSPGHEVFEFVDVVDQDDLDEETKQELMQYFAPVFGQQPV